MEIMKEAECIFTPIQSPQEVTGDPQAMANHYFIEVDHPECGPMKMTGFPWDFSETPASWRREAPRFGQHTDEILSEVGYTPDEIKGFRQREVIK